MKVYDEKKENILEKYDLDLGYLTPSTKIISYPEVLGVEEKGHYRTIREYPNGGKDVEWVVDVKGVEYQPERTEEIEIMIYKKYTEEELLNKKIYELRLKRETDCFPFINRGKLWYDKLNEEQLTELDKWYNDWLNVTNTLVIPKAPIWLK